MSIFKTVRTIIIYVIIYVTTSVSDPGIIFLGDSRTVGMEAAADINDDNIFYVAKTSMGYNWLVSSALDEIEEIKKQHPEYTSWKIYTNLGVNDLGNVEKYKVKYEEMKQAENTELYFVSVNPVDERKWKLSNSKIKEFNSHFENEENYINTYDWMLNNMETFDGLHYTEYTNLKLNRFILNYKH